MANESPRDRRPRLRPVEAFPVNYEGEKMLCLRDPLGVAEGPLLFSLNPLALATLQLFDGEHSIGDIQVQLTRATGELIMTEQITELVEELDKNGYLEGEAFEQRMARKKQAYLELPERPSAVLPGDDAKVLDELHKQWKADADHPLGPGSADIAIPGDRVRGILSPHIDYVRGGYAYSWAYRALARNSAAKTYVILGTVHHPITVPFAATRKPFRTPLGLARVDEEFLSALAKRYQSADLFGDEFAHASEHTIELQVLYLQSVLQGRTDDWAIVPILVGSCEDDVDGRRSPWERPEIREFIEALRETIDGHPLPVCVIGGVDFAHVGPRFGDPEPLTDSMLETVARQDHAMLDAVESVDGEAFVRSFFADGNSRNVCSIAPIYCVLKVFDGKTEGKTLRYGQAVDPDRNGAVTFGSVVFTDK